MSDSYIGDTVWLDIIGKDIQMVEEDGGLDVPFDAYLRLVDVYRMCRDAQAKLQAIEWKPIDTAPKDGRRILLFPHLYTGEGKFPAAGYWDGYFNNEGCWYLLGIGHLNGLWKPTHWMPLPEQPEDYNI